MTFNNKDLMWYATAEEFAAITFPDTRFPATEKIYVYGGTIYVSDGTQWWPA